MNINKIKELVEIIENSSITEFSVKDGEFELTLNKTKEVVVMPNSSAMVTQQPLASTSAPVNETTESEEDDEFVFITSPIVGTFYSASSPETPAYVKVGDIVRAGEPICILEAMKLMNEIECEYDCEVLAVLVSNEQKVGYGQPLFRVKKV